MSNGIGQSAGFVAVVSAWALLSGAAGAQPTPDVRIQGGPQADGNYAWTVINKSDSPVVFLEFPHYHADVFTTPPGWKQECTYLVNVGVEDRPGVCRAIAEPGEGLAPGREARFAMRISKAGALRGTADVQVRLADGTELSVANVEVPRPNTTGETYVSMIGLGVIFVIIAAITMVRRKRAEAGTNAAGSPPPSAS